MLPDLLTPLAGEYQFFNLFRYITFRTGGATITALLISLIFGPAMIRWLKSHQAEGQPIRADGPESHLVTKIGTPTMGGLLILGAFALSTLLWMPGLITSDESSSHGQSCQLASVAPQGGSSRSAPWSS